MIKNRNRNRNSLFKRIKWWFKRRIIWFKSLKKWQKILVVLSPLIAFVVLTPIITFIYFYQDISDQQRLMNCNNTGVVLMDKNGKTFYTTGRAEHRDLVPLDQISTNMTKALLASEDKDFYKHGAFSIVSILRALYVDVLSGNLTAYGGSTLTQQLAKNTLLTNKQTFLRKYEELVVSVAIEGRYSKDQILDMYLNSVYFGDNSFGIEQAAKNYFNKKPSELDLAESAMLVGLLPAPTSYSPIDGSLKLAQSQQANVLKKMQKNGVITDDQVKAAESEVLTYQKSSNSTINNIAPHFTQMVLDELYKKYGEETVKRSGYQVVTSLDLDLQQQAVNNINKQINYIKKLGGSNAGLVAIDPKSGEIRALVGSVDYTNPSWGEVNMTTTARQPGSSFKPIYYSYALADGVITPATIIKDEPININGYSPHNALKTNYGNVTVRQALDWSLNIPAVKVMQKYGIDRAVQAAKNLGITTLDSSKNYGLSLAIGSAEIPLEQVTNAYAAFANAGTTISNNNYSSNKK